MCFRHKDQDHDKPFQQFSDFQRAHRGVTGVITGGNYAQNRKNSNFLSCYATFDQRLINLNRLLNTINGLQTQDMEHGKPFQ